MILIDILSQGILLGGLYALFAAAPLAVAPVPTLAEWSLAALALLVGLGGVARARRR